MGSTKNDDFEMDQNCDNSIKSEGFKTNSNCDIKIFDNKNGDFGKECYNMIKDYKQHNLGVCVFEEIMEPLH
jgi:hypothetical protein